MNFSATGMERLAFKDITFKDCYVRYAGWSGSIVGPVVFDNCDFTNARLKLWGQDNMMLNGASGLISFVNCKLDGLEINARGVTAWLAGDEAEPAELDQIFNNLPLIPGGRGRAPRRTGWPA